MAVLQSEGQRGGERVRGGITVLCMETSPRDWGPPREREGTTPWPGAARPPASPSSTGFTLPGRMGWMEVSGDREGRLVVLVSIILTSSDSGDISWLRKSSLKLERLDHSLSRSVHLLSQTEEMQTNKTLQL